MVNKYEILIPEATYHVYNRANGSESLFCCDENYNYFLRKFKEYISPIADTYCYCLMPNHFHFLIRIKAEKELIELFLNEKAEQRWLKDLQGFKNLEGLTAASNHTAIQNKLAKLISNRFSNFFNAYAKAFNKEHERLGSLFMHTFKRKRIDSATYRAQLVRYIHLNPVEGKLAHSISTWDYSSFNQIKTNNNTFINADEVIEWFSDVENFLQFHLQSNEEEKNHHDKTNPLFW
jgi:putative transposase